MTRCLNLTKTGEYAIAALSRLALDDSRADGRTVSIETLAREQRIPESFLSKILTALGKAGIVRSRRGAAGGVALARPATQITLLAVIEACEGSYWRESCVFYPTRQCDGPRCEVYCPLRENEERVRAGLEHLTLDRMAGALRQHPENDIKEKDYGGRRGR